MELQPPTGAEQPALAVTGEGNGHVDGQPEVSKRPVAEGEQADGNGRQEGDIEEPAAKRLKSDDGARSQGGEGQGQGQDKPREKKKGTALIKEEYLILAPGQAGNSQADGGGGVDDDDAAEGRTAADPRDGPQDSRDSRGQPDKRVKKSGQNKDRDFGASVDFLKLCNSVAFTSEFSPRKCRFGERCHLCHDLRKYLSEGRRPDLETFEGKCPVWEAYGRCPSGWKCRFVRSHSKETEHPDGRKELVLLEGEGKKSEDRQAEDDARPGLVNVVPTEAKFMLNRKKMKLDKSEKYCKWLDKDLELVRKRFDQRRDTADGPEGKDQETFDKARLEEYRAQFVDPPFKPSEKRRLYFGRETPVLAPLTTQGNPPFRRICIEYGAQGVYSEMAMGMPLVQGQKGEWALMKAHESELAAPRFDGKSPAVKGYDNSRDLIFGAQIAGHAAWVTTKATEALTTLCPHLRLVDLNCGCPIDLVFKAGAGSALLDQNAKLERMVRGMNAVSGEVPITVKLRMGVRDGRPTVQKTIERLVFGSYEMRDRLGAPGTAAITLHGRSRQQRYTRAADWGYIAETAALIKSYQETRDRLADTAAEPDPSTMAHTGGGGGGATDDAGRPYFLGNGDCYSHVDYLDHVDNAGVDTVMIGRGALIKPWIFEEIEKGQYIDKSAAERLGIVERFARYGLDTWGSDEMGLGYTRRFLLEYLSFAYRYIPVGILDYLPPRLNDRPPAFRGRNELETLLASGNYKDWIKISEMFLGPAHPDFKFQPKHKSNSYDIEAEG